MRFGDFKPKEGGQSLPFVKLKDGEEIIGVFKGMPHEFGLIWETKKHVPVGTEKSTFRFRINFIVKEGASYVPKVFEQGITVYNMLKELHQSYPLPETAVKIKRSGSTKDDTTYTILPLPPKMQPNENSWRVINETKLIALGDQAQGHQESSPWPDEPPHDVDEEELPF